MIAKRLKEKTVESTGAITVHYKLTPPYLHSDWDDEEIEHDYVVSSGVLAFGTGPETLVFPANKKGKITSWGDIAGSRGYIDPDQAIKEMGYKIK